MRVLIAYAGDNPAREGVIDTPKRVVDAYEELYQGYRECPAEVLDRTFNETGGYDDLVLVKDIPLQLALRAPHDAVHRQGACRLSAERQGRRPVEAGAVVDVYARRLQTQEHMTAQVATAIDEVLKPRGVAVMVEAEHMCMSLRGVEKHGSLTMTTQFTGAFRDDPAEQVRFMTLVRGGQR